MIGAFHSLLLFSTFEQDSVWRVKSRVSDDEEEGGENNLFYSCKIIFCYFYYSSSYFYYNHQFFRSNHYLSHTAEERWRLLHNQAGSEVYIHPLGRDEREKRNKMMMMMMMRIDLCVYQMN